MVIKYALNDVKKLQPADKQIDANYTNEQQINKRILFCNTNPEKIVLAKIINYYPIILS